MVNHNNIRHGSEVIRCDGRIKNAVLIYITVQATPQPPTIGNKISVSQLHMSF